MCITNHSDLVFEYRLQFPPVRPGRVYQFKNAVFREEARILEKICGRYVIKKLVILWAQEILSGISILCKSTSPGFHSRLLLVVASGAAMSGVYYVTTVTAPSDPPAAQDH